jgi:UDP-N-acetylmuramyl pentapeptide phosphotransferase/UDP-N-acetylglucosamine-1-phosphate transferase
MPLLIGRHSRRLDDGLTGPQHVHRRPTSRLGGVLVFLSYALAVTVAGAFGLVAPGAALPLLVAALPVLAAGVREDLSHNVPPYHRLTGAVVSAALASAIAGGVVPRLDHVHLDALLVYLPFALGLTWFMVAGACNAINLIDGVHGLAGGAALLMFGGLAWAAGHAGDMPVLVQALCMIGGIAGFLYWNYPRGRVFLGDAGAYFIGFMYAELSIQLIARNNGISAWFVMMLAAYPIVETLFSIYRRVVLLRTSSMAHDAMHLHSLIYRRVARGAEKGAHWRANARVAPWLWLNGALCTAFAIAFHQQTFALILGLIAYLALYVGQYALLSKSWGSRPFASAAAMDEEEVRA